MSMPDEIPERDDTQPSKSQRKRDAHAVHELGVRLVELPERRLKRLGLETDLLQAVRAAREMRARGARKRQIQFIARLLRQIDCAPMIAALDSPSPKPAGNPDTRAAREALVERVLNADEKAIYALCAAHRTLDRGRLRQLIRQAKRGIGSPDDTAPSAAVSARAALARYLAGVDLDTPLA